MKGKNTIIGLAVVVLGFSTISAQATDSEWVTTNYWAAGGTTTTRMFNVAGEAWQIRYSNRSLNNMKIRVMNEKNEQIEPAIIVDGAIRGVKTFNQIGRFYIEITGDSPNWRVTVRQKLTKLQEWDLRQANANLDGNLRKVASFTGDNGEKTMAIKIPKGSWKFKYQNGEGDISLQVVEKAGNTVIFKRQLNRPERAESWVHDTGEYEFKVQAVESSWRVDVFAEQF